MRKKGPKVVKMFDKVHKKQYAQQGIQAAHRIRAANLLVIFSFFFKNLFLYARCIFSFARDY